MIHPPAVTTPVSAPGSGAATPDPVGESASGPAGIPGDLATARPQDGVPGVGEASATLVWLAFTSTLAARATTVEDGALAAAGLVDRSFAVLFFLLAVGVGVVLSVATLLLDQTAFLRFRNPADLAWLLVWAVAENLGYRQCTVYWRLRGLVRYLRGRSDWGVMTRKGFAAAPTPTTPRPA